MDHPPTPPPYIKWLWLTAGWIFFAIGAVGIVLPGLPTTGPMLFALACFSKGSQRVHDWLLNHRIFGPPIRRWKEHRTIALRAKITALCMMVASMGVITLATPFPPWARAALIGLVLVGMIVLLRVPHSIGED